MKNVLQLDSNRLCLVMQAGWEIQAIVTEDGKLHVYIKNKASGIVEELPRWEVGSEEWASEFTTPAIEAKITHARSRTDSA